MKLNNISIKINIKHKFVKENIEKKISKRYIFVIFEKTEMFSTRIKIVSTMSYSGIALYQLKQQLNYMHLICSGYI